MCQLLGMNCTQPTDITFSLKGFAARGGLTHHHVDGFGIAFFEDKACRLFIDNQPAYRSPVAEMLKHYPIQSKNVIAHIRKASQGAMRLQNCHPFMRELWGRHWIFAHNGELKNFRPSLNGDYQPVGDTDSERAFCHMMQMLRKRFPQSQPLLPLLFDELADITEEIASYGVYNFLMSNGQALFAFCSTNLYYLVRQWPFSVAHLIDTDVAIDFSDVTTPDDRVAVIATAPLTDNESWIQLSPGDLMMFEQGCLMQSVKVTIEEAVQEANAKETVCV
ncbi:MAG: class II glutamine amidotransferase [Burkholderiales bacterium]|jgi:glutamine amidotransferase|nr:class II glutamine amidotransferase [Burkholderiales bacterium]